MLVWSFIFQCCNNMLHMVFFLSLLPCWSTGCELLHCVCFVSTDINECLDSPCAGGRCVNLAGSFRCDCPPGTIKDPSGRICIGQLSTVQGCTSNSASVNLVFTLHCIFFMAEVYTLCNYGQPWRLVSDHHNVSHSWWIQSKCILVLAA